MDARPEEDSFAVLGGASELAALYEISCELNSSLDLDRVLEALLDASTRLVGAPLGYIVLVDRESGARFLRLTRGVGYLAVRDRRSSVAEWVLAEGRPLVVNPPEWGSSVGDSVTGARATARTCSCPAG